MKVFFKLRLLSTLITFFLLFNFISLTIVNIKDTKVISFGIVAQFFSAKNFSMNVVEKMFAQKMQKNKQDNKANKKDQENNKNSIVFLLPNVNIMSMFGFAFYNFTDSVAIYTYEYVNRILDYPLKIPFWRLIFLLLILKILFNVLPRSISINYNKKNIERACIV